MADGLGDAIREVGIVAEPAIDPARPRAHDRRAEVHRTLDIAIRRGRGEAAAGGGHGMLATGHPVVEVVGDDEGQVDIAPRRVQQVGAADAAAAVADQHHDRELGPRELEARGVGQRPAVQAVEGVGDEVAVGEADAADVADDDDLARVRLEGDERLVEVLEQAVVAAARAERQRPERVGHVGLVDCCAHAMPPSSRMAAGEMSVVSILLTPTTWTPSGARRSISSLYWPMFISGTMTFETPRSAARIADSGTG